MGEVNDTIAGLVSIAIPAYKKTFLGEAIESALGQNYHNIELIIVNDNSPYDIDSIVAQYNDSRIRYYKNAENLGAKSIVLNWNRCLSYARGEFFVLLCDDDILMSNFVTELLKLARKYERCNVFHARKINKFINGEEKLSPLWPEYESYHDFINNHFSKKRFHTISEFLYRTQKIKKEGFLVFPMGFYSDNASILNWVKEGIVSSETALCVFRFSDEHISSNANRAYNDGKVQAAIQYWKWVQKFEEFEQNKSLIKEDVESTVYNAFKNSNLGKRFLILWMVPNDMISFKHKLGFIVSLLKNHKV